MKRTAIIWLVLIAVIAYGAYKLAPMYYRHQMMIYEFEGQVKIAHKYDEEEILENLTLKVKEWDMPINPDTILVDRRENSIILSVQYHVDMEFLGKFHHRFYFKIRERGKIRDAVYN
jgi:hypothetical protein